MALTERQKWILGGTILFGSIAIYVQSSKNPLIKPKQIVYPPSSTKSNRIFLSIRDQSELHPIASLKPPLLMNFVYRGEPASNKLTNALNQIVGFELEDSKKLINLVDVEADEAGNKQLLLEYGVTKVPMVVLLEKQLKRAEYVDQELIDDPVKNDVKYDELKKWVEDHAHDIK